MADRDVYIIPFTVTNPTTAPFLQLATPTGCGLDIIEFDIGHETVPTSEQIVMTLMRRTTASTLPTAAAINPTDPTAPATKLVSSTTTNAYGIATVTGTAGALLERFTFNALNGKIYIPTPRSITGMDISQFLTFQFPTAPANAVIGGYIKVAET